MSVRTTPRPVEFREGLPYFGADATVDKNMQGFVKAVDPSTGEEVWRWRNDTPMVASVLATGGDLVFVGAPSGEFYAFHAETGDPLGSSSVEAATTAVRRRTASTGRST